jgi:hypothetical protein
MALQTALSYTYQPVERELVCRPDAISGLCEVLDRIYAWTAMIICGPTILQHARENIRCNSIHPGPIETDMIKDTLSDPERWAERLRRLPLQRAGKPEDIAYGVIYLASDESSFVTGAELVIDGGTTAE